MRVEKDERASDNGKQRRAKNDKKESKNNKGKGDRREGREEEKTKMKQTERKEGGKAIRNSNHSSHMGHETSQKQARTSTDDQIPPHLEGIETDRQRNVANSLFFH